MNRPSVRPARAGPASARAVGLRHPRTARAARSLPPVMNRPRPLAYESRADTAARRRAASAWWRRTRPPWRHTAAAGWAGVAAWAWGGCLLPGGTIVSLAGMAATVTAFVVSSSWLLVRPAVPDLDAGEDADAGEDGPVPPWFPLAVGCAGAAVYAGLLTGLLPRALGHATRPLWRPAIHYCHARRPALAPAPPLLLAGPYLLRDAQVSPAGVRGSVLGGGTIVFTWDAAAGYAVETHSLYARSPRYQ